MTVVYNFPGNNSRATDQKTHVGRYKNELSQQGSLRYNPCQLDKNKFDRIFSVDEWQWK